LDWVKWLVGMEREERREEKSERGKGFNMNFFASV
jgi:hypothetical protein